MESVLRLENVNQCTPEDFFEDYIGKLFAHSQFKLINQPIIPEGRSDYLATTPDGQQFYLEATILRPKQFSRRRPAEDDVCRRLDKMCRVPYLYWFTATASGELYRHLAKSELHQIRRWMETLGTEVLKQRKMRFEFESGRPPLNEANPADVWAIEVVARPRSIAKRGIPDTLLAGFGRSGALDSVSPLIEKARGKTKQHRGVKLPVVLAINDLADFPVDQIDISVALFGWEQNAESGVSRITPPKGYMGQRSVWGRRENSTISGILFFQRLGQGRAEDAQVCLYENPWARFPIPQYLKELFPLAHVVEDEGTQFLCWPIDKNLKSIVNIPVTQ